MEQQQQQQQQQRRQVHRGVINGIARLARRRRRTVRHKLIIDGQLQPTVDRQSLEHLVNFLDGDSHEVTEIMLTFVQLVSHPSPDGGVNVLRGFFSRSDTTLTKVTLHYCNFGSAEETSQLLSAFQTNRTVTDLSIRRIHILRSAALGDCLSGLLQNMPQLQRLECHNCHLLVEGVRAFQPGLRNNHTLKELNLQSCSIRDEGIRLLADALVGNSTLEIFEASNNDISSRGLDDITRILESTRLKSITLFSNLGLFNDEDATQHFVSTLQHKKSSIQELIGIHEDDFPESSGAATYASIKNSLTRNQQLNRVNLLLAPPPTPPLQRQQRNYQTALMTFKTWHKAITKFAMVPNNAGASAIFKLFTARPQLLEKRLQRPASGPATDANTAVAVSYDAPHDTNNDNNNRSGGGTVTRTTIGGQKRRRL